VCLEEDGESISSDCTKRTGDSMKNIAGLYMGYLTIKKSVVFRIRVKILWVEWNTGELALSETKGVQPGGVT
jgi:hypothetical protein